jgi:hypothetical protein
MWDEAWRWRGDGGLLEEEETGALPEEWYTPIETMNWRAVAEKERSDYETVVGDAYMGVWGWRYVQDALAQVVTVGLGRLRAPW